jgi:hypothetical protein
VHEKKRGCFSHLRYGVNGYLDRLLIAVDFLGFRAVSYFDGIGVAKKILVKAGPSNDRFGAVIRTPRPAANTTRQKAG